MKNQARKSFGRRTSVPVVVNNDPPAAGSSHHTVESTANRGSSPDTSSVTLPLQSHGRKSTGGSDDETLQIQPKESRKSFVFGSSSESEDEPPKRKRLSGAVSAQPSCSTASSPHTSNTLPVRQRMGRSTQDGSSSGSETSDSDCNPAQESMEADSTSATQIKSKTTRKVFRKVPTGSQNTTKISQRTNKDSDPEYSMTGQGKVSAQTKTIDKLSNKCVYYILVADQKKYAIKKQGIMTNVFANEDNKLFNAVMKRSNEILKKTFGLELLSVENSKSGDHILVNIQDEREFVEYPPDEIAQKGLLFYILTVIFMNENAIKEETLWKTLERLSVNVKSKVPHPIFGDVRKYVTVELVKQMYLEHVLIDQEPPVWELRWGERAHQELRKKDVLAFACKIFPDTRPENWILQFQDAHKDSATAQPT